MMDYSYISIAIRGTLAFVIVPPIGFTYLFRILIKHFAFNGMDKSDVEEFMSKQSIKSKIFMSYVIRCNPTEYRCLGRTLCILMFHYIQIISVILIFVILWFEVLSNGLLHQWFYVTGHMGIFDLFFHVLVFSSIFGFFVACVV